MPVFSEMQQSLGRHVRLIGKIACGLVIAAAVIYVFQAFFTTRICDDAVVADGSVASVCRHIEMTDPPIVAALLVAVIAFAMLFGFTEISALGISLKRSVAEAMKAETSAREAAEQASDAATSATSTAQRAETSSAIAEKLVLAGEGVVAEGSALESQLADLKAEYNAVRKNELSGPARTARMTAIVSGMIALFSRAGPDNFVLHSALESSDLGTRIAGYAYAYTYPSGLAISDLVKAVVNEPSPHHFGQYWGLRAIRKIVINEPASLDLISRRQLVEYGKTVGPRTDRAYELKEIMNAAPKKH